MSHVLVYLYSFRCCCTCQLSCSVYTFASVLSDIVRTHCTLYTICSSYLAVRKMFLRAYPIYVLATAALNALFILASSRNPQNRAAKYIFLSSKEAPAFPHMMYHRLNNTTSIFLKKILDLAPHRCALPCNVQHSPTDPSSFLLFAQDRLRRRHDSLDFSPPRHRDESPPLGGGGGGGHGHRRRSRERSASARRGSGDLVRKRIKLHRMNCFIFST